MKIVGIIPARYKSSRFPGKPLVPLLGRPMIEWVADLTARALERKSTFVATDDERIADAISRMGYQVLMTDDTAATGTDRLWQAAQQIQADIYVNVQGDEPLVDPTDIQLIVRAKQRHPDHVINGMHPLSQQEDPTNVNIPKVITTEDHNLVYMSRLPIPGFKAEKSQPQAYMKQVCIYAFNYYELQAFGKFGRKSLLESHEDIEILRFLELGIPVKMVKTHNVSLAVDIPEDVALVESALRQLQVYDDEDNRV